MNVKTTHQDAEETAGFSLWLSALLALDAPPPATALTSLFRAADGAWPKRPKPPTGLLNDMEEALGGYNAPEAVASLRALRNAFDDHTVCIALALSSAHCSGTLPTATELRNARRIVQCFNASTANAVGRAAITAMSGAMESASNLLDAIAFPSDWQLSVLIIAVSRLTSTNALSTVIANEIMSPRVRG